MNKNNLSLKQRVIVSFITCIIFLIITLPYIQSYKYPKIFLETSPLEIVVRGAVKYPGVYKVYPGTKIEDLFKRAKIMDKADLSKVDLLNPLNNSRVIELPFLEKISIEVKGAVEEMTLELKPGTRICSLKNYLNFEKDADISVLNSRKKLTNNQKVFIPRNKSL